MIIIVIINDFVICIIHRESQIHPLKGGRNQKRQEVAMDFFYAKHAYSA